jgi:hypothetical protein
MSATAALCLALTVALTAAAALLTWQSFRRDDAMRGLISMTVMLVATCPAAAFSMV